MNEFNIIDFLENIDMPSFFFGGVYLLSFMLSLQVIVLLESAVQYVYLKIRMMRKQFKEGEKNASKNEKRTCIRRL